MYDNILKYYTYLYMFLNIAVGCLNGLALDYYGGKWHIKYDFRRLKYKT